MSKKGEIEKKDSELKFKFHKWKKQLLVADKFITVLAIILVGIFSPEYVVIVGFFLIIPYLILTQRKNLILHLLVSSIVATIWMLIAHNEYRYNQGFLIFMNINLFPLFAWAIGLFISYTLYSHYEHFVHKKKILVKFGLYFIIYFFPLITIETIGYHLFDIKNLAAASYAGLPICDCIHGPLWIQISYIILGPIYFVSAYLLGLENPHYKSKS